MRTDFTIILIFIRNGVGEWNVEWRGQYKKLVPIEFHVVFTCQILFHHESYDTIVHSLFVNESPCMYVDTHIYHFLHSRYLCPTYVRLNCINISVMVQPLYNHNEQHTHTHIKYIYQNMYVCMFINKEKLRSHYIVAEITFNLNVPNGYLLKIMLDHSLSLQFMFNINFKNYVCVSVNIKQQQKLDRFFG